MVEILPGECFERIYAAVNKEIDRLTIPIDRFDPDPKSDRELITRRKCGDIKHALDRLFQATVAKYPDLIIDNKKRPFLPDEIDKKQVAIWNLSTIDEMLDAQFSIWETEIEPWTSGDMDFSGREAGYRKQISLRTALNISRNNIFNYMGESTWGPLWGKTKALELVEKELGI
ncbi:hypothetical protein PNK_p0094 (plasmid) [Candidatus Protochlamydia naegleriophila]|uniref:Uncharacterized protein n=1 Tax=Candidatus Protochlamydia naegleriophila TaxID=389348 RepID=A0A0U5JH63_9BACT|nr:hypothetical protein [Candidatus Protochlamydia naegleriophila]CUI18148.1 hypothetical protein PNK_p0094 [Candidatus Protochlamydia naegleriophila]